MTEPPLLDPFFPAERTPTWRRNPVNKSVLPVHKKLPAIGPSMKSNSYDYHKRNEIVKKRKTLRREVPTSDSTQSMEGKQPCILSALL